MNIAESPDTSVTEYVLTKYLSDKYVLSIDENKLFLKNTPKKSTEIEVQTILFYLNRAIKNFESKYQNEITTELLRIRDSVFSNDFVKSFEDVLNMMFDDKINCGRIIVALIFINVAFNNLLIYSYRKAVFDVTLSIFHKKVIPWMERNKAWPSIIEIANRKNSEHNNILKNNLERVDNNSREVSFSNDEIAMMANETTFDINSSLHKSITSKIVLKVLNDLIGFII